MIRWACLSQIIDTLRADADLAGVAIEAGWPGENLRPELIWVSDIEGELEMPLSVSGTLPADDRFSLVFEVRVAGQADLAATQERVEAIATLASDAIRTDATLDELNITTDTGQSHVIAASLGQYLGPVATDTPDGHLGFAQLTVNVHTRIV